jgi:outer membrane receptor protein involved in Fe transport
VTGLLIGGCATGKSGQGVQTGGHGDQEYVIENPLSLNDFIRRAGVNVDWDTGVPVIRGGYPLYVIDGMRVGHNYYEVARMVNVQDVASVEIIKSAAEGLIYGRDVANGVIIIRTKTGQ